MGKGGTGPEKRVDSAISKSMCSVVKNTVNNCEGLFSVYRNYLEVRRKNPKSFTANSHSVFQANLYDC